MTPPIPPRERQRRLYTPAGERGPSWPVGRVNLVVSASHAGQRLDLFLQDRLGSARSARDAIDAGYVFYNGASPWGAPRLVEGDVVSLFDDEPWRRAEAFGFPVLYEDDDLLAVIKPAGIPMYPGPGWPCRTVANGLRALAPKLSALKGEVRAGILGRLDREVSGVIVAARNEAAHQAVISQYVARTVSRRYLALVRGEAPAGSSRQALSIRRQGRSGYRAVPEGTPGATSAETHWRPLEHRGGATLLEVTPVTGRRHQIRVHLAAAGYPILGDRQYGGEDGRRREQGGLQRALPGVSRIGLHLETLRFLHPRHGTPLTLHAPWPEDLP